MLNIFIATPGLCTSKRSRKAVYKLRIHLSLSVGMSNPKFNLKIEMLNLDLPYSKSLNRGGGWWDYIRNDS